MNVLEKKFSRRVLLGTIAGSVVFKVALGNTNKRDEQQSGTWDANGTFATGGSSGDMVRVGRLVEW